MFFFSSPYLYSSLTQVFCIGGMQGISLVEIVKERVAVTVSNVHGMHTLTGWPKQALKVLAAMPTGAKIGSVDLCGYRFVKGKSAAQIVDEHWLDDGMSKPGRKTRQGHRQTRTGVVEEFGSDDIGSLHAEANLAAQELAACT
jgi:hypothetical protein